MLPIKLKMSAFCSYLNETEIDFSDFGRKGLYLITGDTGAGKTTIFDALSYALYGRASGDVRDPKLFRSKNAPPDIPTFVELTFVSKGKKYTIRRSPEYERPAKRGGGMVKSAAETLLTYHNGEETKTEHLKKGDKTMDDIIGIDAEKFKQLSMIAQGAFMRLLNADTNEKTEILRVIFDTSKYRDLQDELKAAAAKYKNEHMLMQNTMQTNIFQLACDEKSQYSGRLNELKEMNRETIISLDSICELIELIAQEDSKKREELMESSKETDINREKLQTELGKAEGKRKEREVYLDTKQKLEKAMKQLPEYEDSFNSVSGNEKKAEELEKEIAGLNARLADYKKLDDQKLIYKRIELELKNNADALTEKTEKQKEIELAKQKTKAELEELKDCGAELERKRAENNIRQETVRGYQTKYKKTGEYEKSVAASEKCRSEYLKMKAAAEEKQNSYNMMNAAFLDEQAGILADTLQEGQPCPVCGSTSHPCPARKREGAPSKEEVEAARKVSESAAGKMNEASSKAGAANALCEKLRAELDEISNELFGEVREPSVLKDEITKLGTSIRREIEKASGEIAILERQCHRKSELEKKLPDLEKLCETLQKNCEELKTENSVLEQKKQAAQQTIEELKKSLPFEELSQAKNKLTALSKEKKALTDAYKLAEERLMTCRNSIQTHREHLESFGEIDLETPLPETSKLKAEIESLKKRSAAASETLTALKIRMKENDRILNFINDNNDKLARLEEYRIHAEDLYKTASGQLTGAHEKLNIEVFAQARYFDSILALSNIRLRKMSNGKYEFIRSEKALKKQGQFGLDIDVIDHDSGTQRSVKSLSGGESFMASLSLALGFSDVIQSSVGGVHLETMFIDEGFGTLDEKALENAYQVFSDLSTDGSCLVGIISHVEDLKTRIPNRIVVKKDLSGNSHARIETLFS